MGAGRGSKEDGRNNYFTEDAGRKILSSSTGKHIDAEYMQGNNPSQGNRIAMAVGYENTMESGKSASPACVSESHILTQAKWHMRS